MNPNSNGWYVALPDGQALGPYERSELLKLRGTGQISDDSLVWTLDLAEWVPLKRALPAGTGPTTTPAQAHEARRTEARANATQRTHPSPATASKHLQELAQRGLLLQTGKGPATRYLLPC